MAIERDRAFDDAASHGSMDEMLRDDFGFRYLIVRPENGSIWDLLRYAVLGDIQSYEKFFETNFNVIEVPPLLGGKTVQFLQDHQSRWVNTLSILVLKMIAFMAEPMVWTGCLVDFLFNLLYQNGGWFGLLFNVIRGQVVIPHRGTETFVSTIGYSDGRIDLYRGQEFVKANIGGGNSVQRESIFKPELGNRALMDLCIMASKLAYENAKVVEYIVSRHWNMNFVDYYTCWNEYQKEWSTHVFILCDKFQDASLILVSFRGTEPFDPNDWSTDFDFSHYCIENFGKIHAGFLESLGLGSRKDHESIAYHLQAKNKKLSSSDVSSNIDQNGLDQFSDMKDQRSAYYVVRGKLKSLLNEHKNAKFVVTGHSLGGALAILFPTLLVWHEDNEIMERLLGVYTFGQPRIGDEQLKRSVENHLERPVQKYFRVVYCNDLVPRLPFDDFFCLYKHFGRCLYYNSLYFHKSMDEEPNKNFFGMRYLMLKYLNAVWELVRGIAMGYIYGGDYKEGWFRICARVMGLAFPGISAHFPTDYINCVRLGKECPLQVSSF